jgi:uncharacterized protein DUF4279
VNIIWSRPGNPTRGVARTLGITRAQLRHAIHEIKDDAGLGPPDRVTIWDDGQSQTTVMSGSAISTTKSDPGTLKTYASLRFAGDRLEPKRITKILGRQPKTAYRKVEIYRRSRGHEARGRTGLWLLSSKGQVDSSDLNEHLAYLLEILFPPGESQILERLRNLMREDGLEADISCFWHGEHGALPPVVPATTRKAFAEIGATIETDFDTD